MMMMMDMMVMDMVMTCAMEANEQASVRGFVMVDEHADCICDVDYVDDHIISIMVSVAVMNMIIRYAMEANEQASVGGFVMILEDVDYDEI